jgi:membrane-associated protein
MSSALFFWIFSANVAPFVHTIGYIGIAAIIFAESGLFVGFFLPGDTLLIAAGLLAGQGYFSIGLLIPVIVAAAIIGDSVGYAFGKRVGPKLFTREDSFFFRRSHVQSAQTFYEKHGGLTVVLARFVPVVRTFAPILAGVGNMPYKRFLGFNVIGGLLWGAGITLLGYFVGSLVPHIDRYILVIVFIILVASIVPAAIHLLRDPARRAALRKALR